MSILSANLQCSGDISGDMTIITVVPVDETDYGNIKPGDLEAKPLIAVVLIRQPPRIDRIRMATSHDQVNIL